MEHKLGITVLSDGGTLAMSSIEEYNQILPKAPEVQVEYRLL